MIESDGERGASSIKIIFRKESFRSEIKCDIKGKLVKATLKSFSLSMGGRYEEGAGTTRLGIFSLGHLHDEAIQRVWRTRKAPIEMNQGLVSRLHRFSPSTKA